jgi:hypothetical protein
VEERIFPSTELVAEVMGYGEVEEDNDWKLDL